MSLVAGSDITASMPPDSFPGQGVLRDDLLAACDRLLQPALFKDYGPNGLQVEGRVRVRKLVSGVTASLAFIDAAIDAGADALFVHHGLFWRGQDGRVTGWMKQRLARLLSHDINLLAYHLPLDAHAELGNNAQLARRIGVHVLDATHYAREAGVAYIACGHHASERYGAPALAGHVAELLGIEHQFIDIPNPA